MDHKNLFDSIEDKNQKAFEEEIQNIKNDRERKKHFKSNIE